MKAMALAPICSNVVGTSPELLATPADVALLELREGKFEFLDNFKNTITGGQRLFPSATVLAGKRIPHA